MIRSTIRLTIQVLGILGIGLALLVGLAAYRLSSGPIALGFLTPYVEQALSSQSDQVNVRLERTVLAWAGWKRNLDIRVLGATLLDAQGVVLATVPELSLSLSGRALLQGHLAPRTIEVFGPRLQVVRLSNGRFEMGFGGEEVGGGSGLMVRRILADLLAEPDLSRPLSHLGRVRIVGADLMVHDQISETSWHAPGAELSLQRESAGLRAEAAFAVITEGQRIEISAAGTYVKSAQRFDFGVDMIDGNPRLLSRITPELAPLAMLSMPVDGTVTGSLGPDWGIESLGFDLSGDGGELTLPAPVDQSLAVRSAELRGRFAGASGNLVLDHVSLRLVEGQTVRIPEPIAHDMPVRRVEGRGRYVAADNRVEVETLTLDLDGPTATVAGRVDGMSLTGRLRGEGGVAVPLGVQAQGTLRDVPVGSVERVWPRSLGTDAHVWIGEHLTDGTVPRATANLELTLDAEGRAAIHRIDGEMDLAGVTVHYLNPLPPARNVDATATYDRQRFDIRIQDGEAAGLRVTEGRVLITGLDVKDQFADIGLHVEGRVPDALALIDQEPLGFASEVGIRPDAAAGRMATDLSLYFMLAKDLTVDRVKVSAKSTLHDVAIESAIFGLDLTRGRLDLAVNKTGLDVGGTARLGSLPLRIAWRENFKRGADFRSRYSLSGKVTAAQVSNEVGLAFPPFTGDYVRGTMDASLLLTEAWGGTRTLDADIGLTPAELRLSALEWSKPPGVEARARATVEMRAGHITAVPRLSVSGGGLNAAGRVAFAPPSQGGGSPTVKQVRLDKLVLGRTNLSGVLMPNADGSWEADMRGSSLDLAPLADDLLRPRKPGESATSGVPPLTVSFHLDRVWLGDGRSVEQITGAISYADRQWRRMVLDGYVGDHRKIRALIEPKEGRREVAVRSDDAGATLKVLDLFPNMRGGELELTGTIDDTAPDTPMTGRLLISDYRVVKAPLLAQVLSIAALTGILERLGGEGLAFSTLEAPFTLKDGVLEIKDAKATGASLGLTADGKIYTYAEFVDARGTIVPAYALNSLLGNLPLVGGLFSGGEEGGGVFAANYEVSGELSSPTVRVNPLSVLAPGFLRNLFRGEGERPAPPRRLPEPNLEF